MKFLEIADCLNHGRKIKKEHWDEGCFVSMNNGILCMFCPYTTYNYPMFLTEKDLKDDNWVTI